MWSIFQIKKIAIENNKIISEKEIKNKLSYLYGNSLFFLDNNLLETKLREIDFLESFEVKKVYPNILNLKIREKQPIAILHNKKEKKFYTHKGDVINFLDLEKFKNLPTVFGDKKSFKVFYENLKNIPSGVSIESASYMENNNIDENINTSSTSENSEEYTPKLFSEDQSYQSDGDMENDGKIDLDNQDNVNSDQLFDQEINEEDDFEIPAFLRKQKF